MQLADVAQFAAEGRGLAGFDNLRRAEIEVAHASEYAYSGNRGREQNANDYDLQMGPAIGAVNGMIHCRLRFLLCSNETPFFGCGM
jgi:hypothetical protein